MNKVREMVKLINESQDVTVVLVEQNAYVTLELADRGYVLENVEIIIHGNSKKLLNNEKLKKKYLMC
jgi:branched-chain amino acid transport system ATP-binding protein